ncbi:MAG: hypothetical protein KJ556_09870 [Gammaproteobacteria bacterium]|nr:hypothetical protein [Gammaproteobacteria bacterium]MBU2059798.1 hypothetical protein [Gammaproteobacteria bacterium]MBU2175422.1 hypothetical protein [Gammaproteobacteria bacterium]MBU2245670.1 hypothetical protein [Gammaproteobacteria bacterium]MBU2343141.1 hypothetical protein [Gammaproteobacteria bacterium]
MKKHSADQHQLWQGPAQDLTYTELCNALYERELMRYAKMPPEFLASLQKRLASLPFYIRRAASSILSHKSPLEIDSQNASWTGRQGPRCPAKEQGIEQIEQFYLKHNKLALIVPVYQNQQSLETIFLDSVDEIDLVGLRLHCNEHGWFSFNGTPITDENSDKFLLKPTKSLMTAACCGHQWLNSERKSPRVLSLRELLLASRLNWQNFAKPFQP